MGERVRGRCRLLDHGRILLGEAVDLGHQIVDVLQVAGLGPRVRDDRVDEGADLADAGGNARKHRPGIADQRHAIGDLLARCGDQGLDVARGVGAALGERAHFGGNDGKALARIACAGGFDPGVEREQVGLEGDPVDHADDLVDFAGRAFDGGHGLDRTGDDRATVGGFMVRLAHRSLGLARRARGILDPFGDGGHRRAGILKAGGLADVALREVVGGALDFLGAGQDRTAAVVDRPHGGFQRLGRAVEIAPELLVGLREDRGDLHGQVVARQLAQRLGQRVDDKLLDLAVALHGLGIVAEGAHGPAHPAHAIGIVGKADRARGVACGQRLHAGNRGDIRAANPLATGHHDGQMDDPGQSDSDQPGPCRQHIEHDRAHHGQGNREAQGMAHGHDTELFANRRLFFKPLQHSSLHPRPHAIRACRARGDISVPRVQACSTRR
jgi:hypothetical protein